MEENKRTDSGYTGEYGNPVEHNDAPQVETENAAAYSETAQSASEQGASAQAEQSSTYSYSYKNGEGTSTHSGDYYGGGAAQPNNESAVKNTRLTYTSFLYVKRVLFLSLLMKRSQQHARHLISLTGFSFFPLCDLGNI